ncbi:MAG: ATP-dependent helicase [Candidatus Levybacteria bacterium]|nr:ATP-dependent helicase [Candidatus Levybacteria bacterium]
MPFLPSIQQTAVFDWAAAGSGSAIINAVAGSGKTTTLLNMLAHTSGAVAFMAFGKSIAVEIEGKAIDLNQDIRDRLFIGTCHSFGFKALRSAYSRTKMESKKLSILCDRLDIPQDARGFVMSAVSKAKSIGIGILVPFGSRDAWYGLVDHFNLADMLPEDGNLTMESALRFTCQLLKESVATIGEMCDFDDMIYIPVLKGLRMRQYNWVLLDEAQDANLVRLAMAKMMLLPGGRFVAVGDERQAIFGFTGADADCFNSISEQFSATRLNLSVSYRCPKAVVSHAQQWVPHIESAPSAIEGSVHHIDSKTFGERIETLGVGDAILCRNNAPLVSMAYRLIAAGVGCMIVGRDIGMGLVKLVMKWKRIKKIGAYRNKLESWREMEIAKALAKGNENRAATVADQTDCIFAIMDTLSDDETIDVLKNKILALFGDIQPGETPKVVLLSSLHRSKGREWPRVYIYGAETYQPSPYARQEWQMVQERNLSYVGCTRAQEELIYVSAA